MSLLSEIQLGATESGVEISTVRRRATILAARLRNQELTDWLHRELNGYPLDADVPPDRLAYGIACGEFARPFGQQITLHIPESVLPENIRHWAQRAELREPIATYSTLVDKTSMNTNKIRFFWPTDMARRYGSDAYESTQCLHAWLSVEPSSLAGLLDSVRNRLLSFALAIEGENPDAGEADVGSTPVEPAKVLQHFHTIIYGGTNNVAAGSANFSQFQGSMVSPGDFAALQESLKAAGAESGEIRELESELASAGTPADKQRVVDSWLGRTTRAALAATRAFAVEVSAKAMAEYLRPPGR